MRTRNLEIPGSMLASSRNDASARMRLLAVGLRPRDAFSFRRSDSRGRGECRVPMVPTARVRWDGTMGRLGIGACEICLVGRAKYCPDREPFSPFGPSGLLIVT